MRFGAFLNNTTVVKSGFSPQNGSIRCSVRSLRTSGGSSFKLTSPYKPNTRVVSKLPFAERLLIWLRSLQPGRLETLQKQLVELSFPMEAEENRGVTRDFVKTPVDDAGNVINSVTFEVANNPDADTRHVVFIHGYGASLGCFARNFHLINQFKGLNHNYKVHFLDNLSFGLSSNPGISSVDYWKPIPKIDHIKLNDPSPNDKTNLHKKYYKLIDSYDFNTEKFHAYSARMKPVLQDMEAYYADALEAWRKNSRIDKIHFLVGHSFGGYWSGSYALKYPGSLRNLVLLSPVGVERHATAVTAPIPQKTAQLQPSLDPSSYAFLSRWPILSKDTVRRWYNVQPYLPRLLKFMGPFGVSKYYDMWYGKLFAVNKVIQRLGGETVFTSTNQLKYGTNTECKLLIEYLYNSITSGTKSDTHVKYLLTPATTSKWPLMEKFACASGDTLAKFNTHVVYGQYDFMCSEAGEKMVEEINSSHEAVDARFHTVPEGGHNLYIQNPFGTNELIEKLVREED
ncbi:hypothetical protein JCM33374_g6207 [Metschnikowia sp. JCM 33374]|nr:hypothetical protein JCM33374_g6207 [Metschnikowia sp. JCM 33374]